MNRKISPNYNTSCSQNMRTYLIGLLWILSEFLQGEHVEQCLTEDENSLGLLLSLLSCRYLCPLRKKHTYIWIEWTKNISYRYCTEPLWTFLWVSETETSSSAGKFILFHSSQSLAKVQLSSIEYWMLQSTALESCLNLDSCIGDHIPLGKLFKRAMLVNL